MPDILICGMEMPHDCFGCKIAHLESTGLRCNLSHYCPELDCRPQDCPLNELPPHGDLIDRDEVIRLGNSYEKVFAKHFDSNTRSFKQKDAFNVMRQIVKKVPIIIPTNKENKNET